MALQRTPPSASILPAPGRCTSDPNLIALDTDDISSNVTKRAKRTFDEFLQFSNSPTSEIKSMFDELQSQQDQKFEKLNMAINTLLVQNLDIKKTVENMSSQHQELLEKMRKLQDENNEYKIKVSTLEDKIDALESIVSRTKIEIRNLPKQETENKQMLTSIVQTIGSTLDLETQIQGSEIKDIFRTKSGTVVVDFTTTLRKESFLSKFKRLCKEKRLSKEPPLNTGHINLLGPTNIIYISEALTSKSRSLFYNARELVKNKSLLAAWTSFGNVYVKPKDSAAAVRVSNASELLKLVI